MNMEPYRHPWIDALIAHPREEVANLLEGYAAVHPFTRADAPDIAQRLLGHLDFEDRAKTALGDGIYAWLKDIKAGTTPTSPEELQNQVRQVSDAIEIIDLLQLAGPALKLRENYVFWNNWLDKLYLAPSRDPQTTFFVMLANTQRLLADKVADADALTQFWLRLCREAGSGFERRFLQIGLLGLRRLPNQRNSGGSPWIAGLAHWAKETNPNSKEFLRAWLPIKTLHPASPKVLRDQVLEVLTQGAFREEHAFPAWWKDDPDFPKEQGRSKNAHIVALPSQDLREGIIARLKGGKPFSEVRADIETMVRAYDAYTARTGDVYNLCTSLRNVGKQVLRTATENHVERANYAERFARKSLTFEPFSEHGWALWRDALFTKGAFEASIALGYEAIKRIPTNPVFVNELSEILLSLKRIEQAKALLLSRVDVGIRDTVTFVLLSRISLHENDMEKAKDFLREALKLKPGDRDISDKLATVESGGLLSLTSNSRSRIVQEVGAKTESNPFDANLRDLLQSGKLRALRDELALDGDALKELRHILTTDPTFAYAQILAARHKIWKTSEDALAPVAAAFEEALANEDIEQLSELKAKMPRAEALILMACAILGDEDAALAIEKRLASPVTRDDVRVIGNLAESFRPVARQIERGARPKEAILEFKSRLLLGLYDANEAYSVPELLVVNQSF